VAPPLVAAPEAVTPEWLTEVLRDAGALGAGRVTACEAEPVGTGQVGRNVRFRLALRDAPGDAPRSLVCKFVSEDPLSRATGVAQGNYAREVRFYRELAATLAVRAPRCFFAEFDPATAGLVIALEDLAPARPGDQIAGCTPDEAALALAELARLHAPRWGDARLAGLDWLTRRSPQSAQVVQALYQSLFPAFAARFGAQLAPDALALAERLGPRLAGWMLAADGPLTVTHGDYRLDNLLFGGDAGGPPVAVVDWQTPGHGFALADAAYFLGAGLPVAARRANERALLREYHAGLAAGGVTDLSFERCLEDYRRFAFGGVVMAVVASMIVGRSERGDAMFLAMAERHCAHALDWEAEALLP
jgi:hypothetical protein